MGVLKSGRGMSGLKTDGSWVASEEGWESRRGDSEWVAWKRDGWLAKKDGRLENGWVA